MDTNGWIDVKDRKPDTIKGTDYSENVLAICAGESRIRVMAYTYISDGECGGWAWADCAGDIHGDPEYDDDYHVILWQPLPKLP